MRRRSNGKLCRGIRNGRWRVYGARPPEKKKFSVFSCERPTAHGTTSLSRPKKPERAPRLSNMGVGGTNQRWNIDSILEVYLKSMHHEYSQVTQIGQRHISLCVLVLFRGTVFVEADAVDHGLAVNYVNGF